MRACVVWLMQLGEDPRDRVMHAAPHSGCFLNTSIEERTDVDYQ